MRRRCFAIAFVLAGCTNAADPSAHLVLRCTFGDAEGHVAADVRGHCDDVASGDGDLAAARLDAAPSRVGGEAAFLTIPLSNSLRSTKRAITVSAWTYRRAVRNVAVVAHAYPALFFGFHGSQYKWAFERENGRSTACYADRRYDAAPDRWIHIAATYDGWRARLYADGKEICSRWAFGDLAMPDAPFTVGAYLDASGKIVDAIEGLLDDVRIYDVALTAAQIRALARQQ